MKKRETILKATGKLLLMLFLTAGVMTSCSKDKEDNGMSRDDFARTYFDVTDAGYNGERLPNSNTDQISLINVSGNSNVLAGGANSIRISASEGAQEVIMGVQNQEGFFTAPLNPLGSRGTEALMEANLRMLISQQLESNFTLAISVRDSQGNVGPYQYIEVELIAAGTGKLQVSLFWDQENDVDLHLIEPNGERIYFGRRNSTNGGQLDIDSNAACSIDNVNNENITYADESGVTVAHGEYVVEVDLWSNCSVSVPTNYIVRVFYENIAIAPTVGENPQMGVFDPTAPDFEETHTAVKFVIGGTAPKGTEKPVYVLPTVYKLNVDETNKVFENFNPKK